MKKVLLIEPPGGFIRLDRCMQSIDSWGGVYRFPLNLARIGAHLISLGYNVEFIDLQADKAVKLKNTLLQFKPDLCILSCGFPSMRIDANTASYIKSILPVTHISTFGVVPTLLKEDFFEYSTWNFHIPFDSAVYGGEPALGYEQLLKNDLHEYPSLIEGAMKKVKDIQTYKARFLFKNELYKSPFTGKAATYIEGTYGCPFRCSFCVVPELYAGQFSKRSIKDIIDEFKFVIENNNVNHITLWDEGTTFNKTFITQLCEGLIELKKTNIPKFKNFVWTTRSTTALLDEDIVEKLALSGLSGITLGIESFDESILETIEKKISLTSNHNAISLLSKYGIISIGHIILGHINDTKESVENTIQQAINSNLNFAQFYCSVPYPGTKLNKLAELHDLIQVRELTKYELCNPIMNTLGGLTYREVGEYRKNAINEFWSVNRWEQLNYLIDRGTGINKNSQRIFTGWKNKNTSSKVSNLKTADLIQL